MEKNNKFQNLIIHILGTKPISFNSDLAQILGSAKAGLFLSQLLYWWDKKEGEWLFKTIKEIQKETGLSRWEQETAIRICKKFGVLEVKLMGIPARRNFKINIERLIELLQTSLLQTNKQVCCEPTNKFVVFQQTNTENTTENTKNNNIYISPNGDFNILEEKKKLSEKMKMFNKNYDYQYQAKLAEEQARYERALKAGKNPHFIPP